MFCCRAKSDDDVTSSNDIDNVIIDVTNDPLPNDASLAPSSDKDEPNGVATTGKVGAGWIVMVLCLVITSFWLCSGGYQWFKDFASSLGNGNQYVPDGGAANALMNHGGYEDNMMDDDHDDSSWHDDHGGIMMMDDDHDHDPVQTWKDCPELKLEAHQIDDKTDRVRLIVTNLPYDQKRVYHCAAFGYCTTQTTIGNLNDTVVPLSDAANLQDTYYLEVCYPADDKEKELDQAEWTDCFSSKNRTLKFPDGLKGAVNALMNNDYTMMMDHDDEDDMLL
eukprot:1013881_1